MKYYQLKCEYSEKDQYHLKYHTTIFMDRSLNGYNVNKWWYFKIGNFKTYKSYSNGSSINLPKNYFHCPLNFD